MFFFKKKEKSVYEYPVTVEINPDTKLFSMYRTVDKRKIGVAYDTSCDFSTYIEGIAQIKTILENWEVSVSRTRDILGLAGPDPISQYFKMVNISNIHLRLDSIQTRCMMETESWILFKRYVLFPIAMLINPKAVQLGKYNFINSLLNTCQSHILTTVIPQIDPKNIESEDSNTVFDPHDLVIGQVVDERNLNGILDLMLLYDWVWLIPLQKYYDPNPPMNVLNLA